MPLSAGIGLAAAKTTGLPLEANCARLPEAVFASATCDSWAARAAHGRLLPPLEWAHLNALRSAVVADPVDGRVVVGGVDYRAVVDIRNSGVVDIICARL